MHCSVAIVYCGAIMPRPVRCARDSVLTRPTASVCPLGCPLVNTGVLDGELVRKLLSTSECHMRPACWATGVTGHACPAAPLPCRPVSVSVIQPRSPGRTRASRAPPKGRSCGFNEPSSWVS